MKGIEQIIQSRLLCLKDEKNQVFVSKLIPTVSFETILWIKVPVLRKLTKEFLMENNIFSYLDILPHYYFEESYIHAFLLESIRDIDSLLEKIDVFLPYIDNRAICDSFRPKIFKKYPIKIYDKCLGWINGSRVYTIRYWVWILLSFYLDKYYRPEVLDLVANISSDDYYVQMMQSWFFATAIVKQPRDTVNLLKQKNLPIFVQNKAIQKAKESRRVDRSLVDELQKYKIK